MAKSILAEIISVKAEDAASDLRRSARKSPSGVGREVKRGLADAANDIAANPEPVVRLLEQIWDENRKRSRGRQGGWS